MKLLSYEAGGSQSYGVLVRDGIVDLARKFTGRFPTLRDLLSGDGLGSAEAAIIGAKPDYSLKDVRLLRPIAFPEKIICVGVNYVNSNAQFRDNSELPKKPSLFVRFPGSLVAHGDNLIRPPESQQLDYEGEIAVVIGKGGRRIPSEEARQHIAGLTIVNEGTLRDWIKHGKFNVTQGKTFEKTGAIGPWIVTADEFASFDDIHISTRVNGETRQDDTTANLLFKIPYLLNYISTFTELKPGDIISTGTPTGVGVRFNPPRFLVPGDVVEVEVSAIGILRNTVVDEIA
jgi:5-carboxymethyl-2-hydroxymuconate isomerase